MIMSWWFSWSFDVVITNMVIKFSWSSTRLSTRLVIWWPCSFLSRSKMVYSDDILSSFAGPPCTEKNHKRKSGLFMPFSMFTAHLPILLTRRFKICVQKALLMLELHCEGWVPCVCSLKTQNWAAWKPNASPSEINDALVTYSGRYAPGKSWHGTTYETAKEDPSVYLISSYYIRHNESFPSAGSVTTHPPKYARRLKHTSQFCMFKYLNPPFIPILKGINSHPTLRVMLSHRQPDLWLQNPAAGPDFIEGRCLINVDLGEKAWVLRNSSGLSSFSLGGSINGVPQ